MGFFDFLNADAYEDQLLAGNGVDEPQFIAPPQNFTPASQQVATPNPAPRGIGDPNSIDRNIIGPSGQGGMDPSSQMSAQQMVNQYIEGNQEEKPSFWKKALPLVFKMGLPALAGAALGSKSPLFGAGTGALMGATGGAQGILGGQQVDKDRKLRQRSNDLTALNQASKIDYDVANRETLADLKGTLAQNTLADTASKIDYRQNQAKLGREKLIKETDNQQTMRDIESMMGAGVLNEKDLETFANAYMSLHAPGESGLEPTGVGGSGYGPDVLSGSFADFDLDAARKQMELYNMYQQQKHGLPTNYKSSGGGEGANDGQWTTSRGNNIRLIGN